MNKRHALATALVIALAATAGTVAAVRTAGIGGSSTSTSSAQIDQRNHALDRAEAALRKALAEKLPKLPALPSAASTASGPAASAPAPAPAPAPAIVPARPAPRAAPARAPKIVYVRPKPIIVTRPRAGGDDESEEHESAEAERGDEIRALGGEYESDSESAEADD